MLAREWAPAADVAWSAVAGACSVARFDGKQIVVGSSCAGERIGVVARLPPSSGRVLARALLGRVRELVHKDAGPAEALEEYVAGGIDLQPDSLGFLIGVL